MPEFVDHIFAPQIANFFTARKNQRKIFGTSRQTNPKIRIARLDPFGDIEVSDAAKIFSPFRLINFADQVKLILPEAMGCWPDDEDEEAEHQWYCRLETETSHAGMFVTMEEMADDFARRCPFGEDIDPATLGG